MSKFFSLILITFLVYGCSSTGEKAESHHPISSFSGNENYLDNPVLIASDLQIHLVHNSNNERTNFKDIFSEAIRPVAADIFAPHTFESTIFEYQYKYPKGKMIFLGDMMDVACKWELKSFYKLMDKKYNWVIAPGNHDFNYLGTFEKDYINSSWKNACEVNKNNDERLNKNEYIFSYLSALASQSDIAGADESFLVFANCLKEIRKNKRAVNSCLNSMAIQADSTDGIDRNCAAASFIGNSWVNCKTAQNISIEYENIPNQGWWKNRTNKNGFLQDVFWYINPVHDFYSFIIQRVKLPDGRYAVLLDTNNPQQSRGIESFPIGYNPANSANMLYHQMNAASKIMGGGDIFTFGDKGATKISKEGEHILMSHHPVSDYKFKAKDGLCLLSGTGNVREIYTAHTHSSYIKKHGELDSGIGGCSGITEYNIGSMIDAPIELSLLMQMKSELKAKPYRVSLTKQFKDQCNSINNDKLTRWKRDERSQDFYTAYTQFGLFSDVDEIQTNLMKTMIGHYLDMLSVEDGFETMSANWPEGISSDKEVEEKLKDLDDKLSNFDFDTKDKASLLQLSEFFLSRKVKNMMSMKEYQNCQLYWASEAKKELSWYDRI